MNFTHKIMSARGAGCVQEWLSRYVENADLALSVFLFAKAAALPS